MRKTTVREYDPQGNLVREVITEQAETYYLPTVQPNCTCGTSAICAVHRYYQPYGWPVVTCAGSTYKASDQLLTFNVGSPA